MANTEHASRGRRIELRQSDFIEALRLERELAKRQDEWGVAQNELMRFNAHMRAIYGVPAEYELSDWDIGFEPPVAPETEAEDQDDKQDDQ